ncbi:MAG: zinc-ribbon domain-containing protein, partial [Deltaproteobacteria bacterium]|nr:zinc-ribbon domain-containing protein [Deltaproteobacteria bacterium]
MDIICEKCQGNFRIADEKIPAGKTVSFPCPKCKEKICISGEPEEKNIKDSLDEGLDFYASDEYGYESDEKLFNFVEEEGNTALICEEDPVIKKKISKVLNLMEYHITEVENSRDALTKLRYHPYDLVITNERFDTSNPDANTVLTFLERRSMPDRRNTCLILISSRFRTMDN